MKFFTKSNIFYSLITLVILAAVSISFIQITTNDTRKETEEQMRDLSNQSISVISQKFHADSVCLHSIAETVGNSTLQLNTKELRSYLNRKRAIYGFSDIVVVDLEGKAMSAIGTKLPNLKNQEYFKLAFQGKVVLHNGLSSDGSMQHMVRIATPLQRNGRTVAVLFNTIEQFFDSKFTSIAPTEHEHYMDLLHNDRQGFAIYTYDGEEYLVSLTPMDMHDFKTTDHARWYLSMAVPYELIAAKSRTKIFQTTGFVFALMLIIGILIYALYRSKQKKRAELQKAYEEVQSLYRTIPTPIIRFRMEDGGIVLSDNRSFANLVGCPHETCQHRFRFFTKQEFIDRIWALPDGSHQMEMLIRGYGKKYIWHLAFLEITTKPEGREVLCVLANITQQREKIHEATLVSQTDALTGLANRRGIQEQLEPLFVSESTSGALLIMDLDNFKQVNDKFGHQTGDTVLAAFADMLVETLPDTSFISRYGGDEFVVFLPNTDKEQTCAIAGRIKDELAKQFPLFVKTCRFGVSFGSVFFPEDGRDWNTLFTKVDEVLYTNKRLNKMGEQDAAQ